MKIGVPKEIKNHEYRVGVTPSGVKMLVQRGHQVEVQSYAGTKIGFSDDDYVAAGAMIVDSAADLYKNEMIVKVKEPQPVEYEFLYPGQLLFTYLHLAPDPVQTSALLEQGVVAIAYETVTDAQGRLPLLIPMSEIAGRLSIQAGANALQLANGGNGMLLGGVAGVPQAKVTVIGGGVVGTQAARMAMGLGAEVTVLDKSLDRLRYLDDVYGPLLKTRFADSSTIEELAVHSDLLIGAVLIPGKLAPKLISRSLIAAMKPGSVFVDVAIDQGGCADTSKATTHQDPTYVVDDVVHYCVANMPGAVARTATMALTNATLPYVITLADSGLDALQNDTGLQNGLNVFKGKITNSAVARDLNYEFVKYSDLKVA